MPGIAGRSPSYLVRQLYDMKAGTRKGSWIDLMKPVVVEAVRRLVLRLDVQRPLKPPNTVRR